MEDVCAICLDPQSGVGSVVLYCGHDFHAECLLSSFSGNPASDWRCPICRAAIVRKSGGVTTHSRHLKDISPALETGQCHGGPTPVILQTSRWGSLAAFLSAASKALYEHDRCMKSNETRHGCNACNGCCDPKSTQLLLGGFRSPLGGANGPAAKALTFVDIVCPAAGTAIMSFAGRCHVQCLLNPRAPHPWVLVLRYAGVLLASIVAVGVGICALHAIMGCAGHAVCAVADALQHALKFGGGAAGFSGEECQPMVPDGWLMPAGFAALGAYISVQVCWLCGITLSHALLHWDKCALRGLSLWFVVCIAYTAFVYIARLLLTLAVVFSTLSSSAGDDDCMARLREGGLC